MGLSGGAGRFAALLLLWVVVCGAAAGPDVRLRGLVSSGGRLERVGGGLVAAAGSRRLLQAPTSAPADEAAADHVADVDAANATDGHAHASASEEEVAALGKEAACAAEPLQDYDLGLHIGSVFILLAVSLAGSLIPVVLHITKRNTWTITFIKLGTFFGIGTILSTAFIHMLGPANEYLRSPCLPSSWLDSYEAWAYLFVVASILGMQLLDYLVEGAYLRMLAAKGGDQACEGGVRPLMLSIHTSRPTLAPPSAAAAGSGADHAHAHAHAHAEGSTAPPPSETTNAAESASAVDEEAGDCTVHGAGCKQLIPHAVAVDASQVVGVYLMEAGIVFHRRAWYRHRGTGGELLSRAARTRGMGGCRRTARAAPAASAAPRALLRSPDPPLAPASSPAPRPPTLPTLRAGHSVLIGITLGVTAGGSFKTLLIALAFHQFFEGFAIGSAAIDSGIGAPRAALMTLVYSLTTPTGIAIGIGIRESFNQNSTATLLAEGILDSISSGILIYVVLIELLNPMMNQSAWLRAQRWPLKLLSFASLYAGAAVLALIGKWA
eukprot:scaffold21.g2159.t1